MCSLLRRCSHHTGLLAYAKLPFYISRVNSWKTQGPCETGRAGTASHSRHVLLAASHVSLGRSDLSRSALPLLQSIELHSELPYKKRKAKNMPVEQEFNPLVTAHIFLTLAGERSKE